MIQTMETSITSTTSTTGSTEARRRSTFYVPLSESERIEADYQNREIKKSIEQIYNPDLSACSFEFSLDESLNDSGLLVSNENIKNTSKSKRYGVVLNGLSIDDDDDEDECHKNTSTPIKLMKSRSRSNILSLPDKSVPSPNKEKSKTLPQNLSSLNSFPPKNSFLLKSTPKISLNYSSDNPTNSLSPKKSLSFIRRAHSTKISRSNSLLKSLTSKCVDQSVENLNLCRIVVQDLYFERLEKFWKAENFSELVKDVFFKEKEEEEKDEECENGVHSGKLIILFLFIKAVVQFTVSPFSFTLYKIIAN